MLQSASFNPLAERQGPGKNIDVPSYALNHFNKIYVKVFLCYTCSLTGFVHINSVAHNSLTTVGDVSCLFIERWLQLHNQALTSFTDPVVNLAVSRLLQETNVQLK